MFIDTREHNMPLLSEYVTYREPMNRIISRLSIEV